MEIQKERILEVLSKIHHPETKENIVSMRLVEDVKYKQGAMWLNLQFSRPNDPFIQSLKKLFSDSF